MTASAHHLALYTFGLFRKPAEDPANDGFHAINDPIFDLVDQAPGLIARAGYDDEPDTELWGEQVWPRWYVERGDGWSPATLSVWDSAEAIAAFTYFGLHAQALRQGKDWFRQGDWPPLVMWWVAKDQRPTWQEGVERYHHLADHGPTATAFSVKSLFDPAGNPAKLAADRVAALRVS